MRPRPPRPRPSEADRAAAREEMERRAAVCRRTARLKRIAAQQLARIQRDIERRAAREAAAADGS